MSTVADDRPTRERLLDEALASFARRGFEATSLDAVAAGRDPVGVVFDESEAMVDFEAGNYLE